MIYNYYFLKILFANINLYGIPQSLKNIILLYSGIKEKAMMFTGIQYDEPSTSDGVTVDFSLGTMSSGLDSKNKFHAIAQEMLMGAKKI